MKFAGKLNLCCLNQNYLLLCLVSLTEPGSVYFGHLFAAAGSKCYQNTAALIDGNGS